jgi:hypothetical protein
VPKDNLPQTTNPTEAMELALDKLPALDVADVVDRTLERILGAETPEEAGANPEAMGLRDWVGRQLIVNDVAGVLPSTRQGPLSRYVILDITDPDTGERANVTTGGIYAVATALKYWGSGWLPCRFKVVELESQSNPGQTSIWLVKA